MLGSLNSALQLVVLFVIIITNQIDNLGLSCSGVLQTEGNCSSKT